MVSSFTPPAETITTAALVERIRADYGVSIDPRTITFWCSRPDNPLRPIGPVVRGQARRFDWHAVRDWIEWHLVGPGGLSLEHIRGIEDITTRLRMSNRWRRSHGLPPALPEGTWAEKFHP